MYYFIVNNSSKTGKGEQLWKNIENKLKAKKTEYKAVFTTLEHGAEEIARDICKDDKNMKTIVVVGGDGTVNAVANGISGYDKVMLGLVPTGSGNDFARGVGVELDTVKAAEKILSPREIKKIDIGLAEALDEGFSKKFAVSSGMGYDADICCAVEHSKMKKVLNKLGIGRLIYFIMGLKLIFSNKPSACTITIDGVRKIKYKKLIFAANMNGVYEGGGMPMGPNADPTDGKVTVTVVHDMSKFRHLSLMPTVIKGKHIHKKGVDEFTGKTIEIETEKPMTIHTDGEVVGRSGHIRFSCLPDQVRMMT